MSFGSKKGTKSSSSGYQQQTAENYGSDIWGPQAGFLGDLYARAQQQSFQPNAGMGTLGNVAGMFGQAGSALGQSQAALNRLANPTEADPMQAVYARNLGQMFNEQIMPGLKGDAMVGGGLGGSRAGIAQGLAGARVGQQLQDFSAQLYGDQQNRALQAGQALQGVGQGYGQLGAGYQDLATQQSQMPWQALQQYAGLLGPAVMQQLGSYSQGTATNRSKGSGGGGFDMRLW
jgi:hypothetical protein